MMEAAVCAETTGTVFYEKAMSDMTETFTRRRLAWFDNWNWALQISVGCDVATILSFGLSYDVSISLVGQSMLVCLVYKLLKTVFSKF